MVQFGLIVTDSKNKSLNTVTKDDIRLVEGKVEQTVLSVERDERPVDCVLLIDSSGSLRSLMPVVMESARLVIMNRRPEDEILIMRFIASNTIQTVQKFTRDGDALMGALRKFIVEGGQSAVIDALYTGVITFAEFKKTGQERRRVVVVITDGEDRNSYYRQEQLVKLLQQSDVQIFALGLVTDLDKQSGMVRISPRDKAEKLLQMVTSETGGRVFFPKNQTELIDSMEQIITDLRGQFRVRYQPANGEKKEFRKIDVKLVSPNGEKRKAIVSRAYELP
jgi:Ca-activated chloride channel family protein